MFQILSLLSRTCQRCWKFTQYWHDWSPV